MIDCGWLLLFGSSGGFVGFVGFVVGCIKDTTFGHLSPQVSASISRVDFLVSGQQVQDSGHVRRRHQA
jgi:hypothetical protein